MTFWNRVLWEREWNDAKWLTVGACLLMFSFAWVYVWLMAQIDLGPLALFLKALPSAWERLSPVPFTKLATSPGLLSALYVDPVVLFTCIIWAIARGSSLSGEADRGTMEMLLAQPVSRLSVVLIGVVITVFGAAAFSISVWVGSWVGMTLVRLKDPVDPLIFIPSAFNLFCTIFCVAGMTTAISAADRYRWRTVGVIGGIFIVQLIIKVISRMWISGGWWLKYATFLTGFEPQALALVDDRADLMRSIIGYNAPLLLLGTAGFVAACVTFCRRDLPAPV
jgi:ABC-2 type transport system permease protein